MRRGMTGKRKIYTQEELRSRHRTASREYYRRQRLRGNSNLSDDELERKLIEKFKKEGWD